MNLIGKTFGKLKVLSLAGKEQLYTKGVKNGYNYKWRCLCECGNETVVSQCHLRSGHTLSCGCHQREKVSKTNKLSTSRLYGVWRDIKNRCYDEKAQNYSNYGGRGIKICDEWKNNFLAFYEWSMKNGYDEKAKKMKCTIDRIDTNKDYSPNNCRWVENVIQQRNKRTNKIITINGKRQCIKAWCEEYGIRVENLYSFCKNNKKSLDIGLYVLTHKKWNKSTHIWEDK